MTHQLKNKTRTSVASTNVHAGKKGKAMMPPTFQLKSDRSELKTLKQFIPSTKTGASYAPPSQKNIFTNKGNATSSPIQRKTAKISKPFNAALISRTANFKNGSPLGFSTKTNNSNAPSVIQRQLRPYPYPIGIGLELGHAMAENYLEQERAIDNPAQIDSSGRLGAMLGAQKFEEGQVGYGVNPAIRGIHTVFGDVGQQNIGEVFNSPEAQELLAAPNTFKNNRQLAQMEYDYWKSQVGQGETLGDEAMIRFGAAVPPGMRAGIQMGAGYVRGATNDVIEGVKGAGNWISEKWGNIFD